MERNGIRENEKSPIKWGFFVFLLLVNRDLAVWTRLELATPCVTGRYSNQLNYQTKIYYLYLDVDNSQLQFSLLNFVLFVPQNFVFIFTVVKYLTHFVSECKYKPCF